MILRLLSSLLVRVAAGIELITEDERPVIEGSGPHVRAENGPRETQGYETSSSSSLRTVRTSTRRRPRYWGTTSRGKTTSVSVFAAAGSRLTIEDGRRRTDGSGRPPLAGKGPMLRELETLV